MNHQRAWIGFVIVLLVGCGGKKDPAPNPSSDTKDPAAAPAKQAPGGIFENLVRIKPKARFKLPGEASDRNVRLSSNGHRVAVVHQTPESKSFAQVWDISAEPKLLAQFDGHSCAISPSGKFILVGKVLSESKIYEIDSQKVAAEIPTIFSFGFFRDDETAVVTTRSHMFTDLEKGRITQWSISKNADAGSFDVPDNRFSTALPAKNAKEYWLFMSNKKFEVECYDLDTKTLARTIRPAPENPKEPYSDSGIYEAIAPDSSVFASDVRRMHFYDTQSGKILADLPDEVWACSSGFLPGGPRCFVRPSRDGTKELELAENDLLVYAWKARKVLAALTGHTPEGKEAFAAASGDGKTVVTVTKTGQALVFDLGSVK